MYTCFISKKPLKIEDVAFAYHPFGENGTVSIHKKYMTSNLRKQWVQHQKRTFLGYSQNLSRLTGIGNKELSDLIERSLPSI